MDEYYKEEAFPLRKYWETVRKRLWLILAILTIVGVSTYLHMSRKPSVYRATAKVLIQRFNPQVVQVDEVMALDAWTDDYYQTQYEILKSRSLARQVVQELELHEHPEFNKAPQKSLLSFNVRSALASVVHQVFPPSATSESNSENAEKRDSLTPYINAYLGGLSIKPIPNSRLVNISFAGGDPDLCAELANAHARAYIRKNLEMKVTASEEAIGWLNSRLGDLKNKLRESELALQGFQEQEDIITLESVLSQKGSEENLVVQKMAELNNKLTAARTERIGLETLFRQLQQLEKHPGMVESIPYVIQNEMIQTLKTNLIELNQRYSELREKYGKKHPRMVGLRKEIGSLNYRLANEVKKIAKSVEIQYQMASAKENSLQGALDQTKSEVMNLNKKAIQYGVLKREVETNRQLYDMILKRAKETSLTSGLKSTNIFVDDDAETPGVPIGPQTQKKVTMAAFLGLLLGLGLAFLLEHLDNTIHGPEEIARHLDVPFLGPAGLASWDGDGRASELVVIKEPRSHFAESMRNIRTNILFSFTEPEQKAVVITSPAPMEGKTFISCNLAVAMAKMGRRVLLIDADMRKPRVHKVFNLQARPGLSNLIVGRCELQEALRNTWLKHLQVMPAGKIPPNPSELLGSRRMQRLLAQLKEFYEFIVFDTPPVLSVTDGAVLAGMMDGAVLTVKASETTQECAQLALKNLADVRAQVLGVIVNQVDFRKDRYYYNYYYKYYDYYAKDGEKREKKIRGVDRASRRAAAMI